jgi:hypothetical protein
MVGEQPAADTEAAETDWADAGSVAFPAKSDRACGAVSFELRDEARPRRSV